TGRPINFGVILRDVLRRARVKKRQRFSFGDLLTQFLRLQQIEEEVVYYRQRYGPKGLDVSKIKEPKGIHGPVLSISDRNARIDYIRSYLYDMQMLHLRMSGVTEEQLALDNDDAIDDEQARTESDLVSDANDGEESVIGQATYAPIDEED
ncbi:hypothetical protein HAX54_006338, partial [Datura stramonium]|nr:hypothetical protein [Datura stramonium]